MPSLQAVPSITKQQQSALAAHQAKLVAARKALGAPLRSANLSQRLSTDLGKKGLPMKKRRPGDTRLPEKASRACPSWGMAFGMLLIWRSLAVRVLVPSSVLLCDLQAAERRVDALLARKRGELQDMHASFRRGAPGTAQAAGTLRKKLRVYVFTEHAHQGAEPGPDPPSWALHIQAHGAELVQLDPEQYPGSSGTIVWERARHDLEERESFIVRRAGRLPARATVSLELDHNPQLYLPSPALASLLGLQGLHSLPFVLQMLWGYIKQHNLFESSPAAPLIRCDAALRAVTEQASLGLAALQEAVRGHLAPPPPAVLEVAVPAGGPSPSHPACYDLVTEVPIPVDAVHHLVAAQARDLRIAAGGDALDVLPPADVFAERWVEDAALRVMAARGSAAG
ncbi:SWI/SNF complex component SNF12-like protein [Auxenochlorella protothecoides]|uniref:SWI/SNF complex component SNF12-like protein n=2 Tax=Auxenochlorella protothecoides TaxID=3075 RepID=A0A087SA67_AUXPR|nr:SWI/SNF complex component SNF12-like protein [Auxenochlorella protothecoides]KFM22621.1 SWI/SNF complex component SNF12-like protein [Auxenochlorella protothecoides]